MKYLIIVLSLALSSCAALVQHNQKTYFPTNNNAMQISIHKLEKGNYNVLAYTQIQGNVCKIYLRHYPQCLLHEVRHCFEGNWHKGKKSDEDCY